MLNSVGMPLVYQFSQLMLRVQRRAEDYGGCPGDVTGFYLRCQGELLGLWDPQNRDPRRKPPPGTIFFGWLIINPSGWGVLISGQNMYTYHIYIYIYRG